MSESVQTTHPPRHVLAISNGIVNLPEYILKNSHFLLEKNEIFGDIIYGKLNLFCPPQEFLGGGKIN